MPLHSHVAMFGKQTHVTAELPCAGDHPVHSPMANAEMMTLTENSELTSDSRRYVWSKTALGRRLWRLLCSSSNDAHWVVDCAMKQGDKEPNLAMLPDFNL